MINFLKARRVASTLDDRRARYADARTSGVAMRSCLMDVSAQPWWISEDHDFRDAFTTVQMAWRKRTRVHHSLRAHYDRLDDVAIEAMLRFLSPDVVVTVDQLNDEITAVSNGEDRLTDLNRDAWASDALTVDARGQVDLLLQDADRTVRNQRALA